MSGTLSVSNVQRRVNRPHGAKDPGYFHAHRRLKGPLRIAKGPGSIMAASEMKQLVETGRYVEAAELYRAHHAIRGATAMQWGHAWYKEYTRGK